MTTTPLSLRLRIRCWFASQHIMRLAALVGIAAFLADWSTKSWAVATLNDTKPFSSILLAFTHNEAFAFSAGADRVTLELVMVARLLALYAVGVLFGRFMVRDRRSAIGFGLILGGGFGNTADVAFRGAVVDFINVTFGNVHLVFNGADIAILLGLALLAPRIRTCALEVQHRIGAWEARVARDHRLIH